MIRFFAIVTLGISTLFATGCSGAGDQAPMLEADDPGQMQTPDAPKACQNHEEGCPCDFPGDVVECGRVKRIAGDYVWCSTGTQTCDQYGSWGKCEGDGVSATPTAAE